MNARKHILVTGGTGFIGSALVIRLVRDGYRVRVLDNQSRGNMRRLASIANDVELVSGDIRDPDVVADAHRSIDCVFHLAYINGTEYFYEMPELVLEVGVKGMINVLDACRTHDVRELVVASSSEVYQTPPTTPTDEHAPLVVPDVMNPRYSYGGGKIISELMAINYGRKQFDRVMIFRPHNVYGPDMGWEHVLPQFITRMHDAAEGTPEGRLDFPIQGNGNETRAFIYIEDFVEGLMVMLAKGQHLNIYHVGTTEEVSIADVALEVARCFNRDIRIVPGDLLKGGTPRRCPNIGKLSALGFTPTTSLRQGLPAMVEWYTNNRGLEEKFQTITKREKGS